MVNFFCNCAVLKSLSLLIFIPDLHWLLAGLLHYNKQRCTNHPLAHRELSHSPNWAWPVFDREPFFTWIWSPFQSSRQINLNSINVFLYLPHWSNFMFFFLSLKNALVQKSYHPSSLSYSSFAHNPFLLLNVLFWSTI